MADTDLNAGDLTVTITEALSVGHDVAADGRDFAQTCTHTFSGILNTSKRIIKLVDTALIKVATFGTDTDDGAFVRGDVRYIRVTNLDGTATLQVGLDDDSDDAAYIELAPATSIVYTAVKCKGGSGATSFDDASSLRVKGVADHQLEVFIASV
jgi:hypothetical protein